MTQTKHENKQKTETTDTCFCEKSFIDRSFLVLEILKGAPCAPPPLPRWQHKSRESMVNRVKIYVHIEKSDLVVSLSRSDNFKKSAELFKKCADIFKKLTVIMFKKITVLCRKCAILLFKYCYLRSEQYYARRAQQYSRSVQ